MEQHEMTRKIKLHQLEALEEMCVQMIRLRESPRLIHNLRVMYLAERKRLEEEGIIR